MRTWVSPSIVGGQTGQKEKELRPQVWAEMPPEPCLETSEPGPWRRRPLLRVHGHGNPEGQCSPPGTTSCLSSRAPWSPHLYRAGPGVAGRSELQTCLPSSLSFSSSARCAGHEGTAGGHGMPTLSPAHENHRARAAGGARDPDGERISPSFW